MNRNSMEATTDDQAEISNPEENVSVTGMLVSYLSILMFYTRGSQLLGTCLFYSPKQDCNTLRIPIPPLVSGLAQKKTQNGLILNSV
jgi:hypothetical protein